jgi:TP901 family phage tail tape measure protein
MSTTVGTAVLELLGDASQFTREMQGAAAKFEAVGRRLQDVGGGLTKALTVPLIGVGVVAGKAAIDFESSFAGIRKTMDLTEGQFQQLAQANRDLAKQIPVSANKLNRIGELAGQLGIRGVQNVLKFEDTIAKLAVTTDLTAEQGALAFAQIANVLQLPQDQIDRLGASIVGLGNNFATTESRIVDFAQRIAGAGQIAGLTAGAVTGIGTAFASVGVEAEAGGSAIQKVLIDMVAAVSQGGEALDLFAATAGKSAGEFAAAFQQDAAGAFVDFVEGLGRQGTDAIKTLEALGLTDQRLTRAFLSTAGAGDLLRRAVERGNREFEANNALTTEANKRFDTAASRLTVFWNKLKDVGITFGNVMLPALTAVLEALEPLVKLLGDAGEMFADLPKPIKVLAGALGGLVVAIGPVLLAFGSMLRLAPLVTAGLAAMTGAAANFGAFIALAAGVRSLSAALALLQAAMGPVGWVLLGIGATITAATLVWRKFKNEAADTKPLDDAASATDRMRAAVSRLNGEQLIAQRNALLGRKQGLVADIERLTGAISNANKQQLGNLGRELDSARANLIRTSAAIQEVEGAMRTLQQLPEITADASAATAGTLDLGGDKDKLDDYVRSLTRAVALGIASRQEQAALRQIMLQQRDIAHGLVGTAEDRVVALERARDAAEALLTAARKDIAVPNMPAIPQMPLVFGPSLDADAERAAANFQRISESLLLLADGFNMVGMRAADSLAALVGHANQAGEVFAQFTQGVLQDISRMIARFIALKAVTAFLNFVSPGLGTAFASGSDVVARASGGPVMANHSYLVGEKGPELFTPKGAGNIVPNAALAGGGTLRLDTSSLPPRPAIVTPDAVATDDWWRRAFSALSLDYADRGGL